MRNYGIPIVTGRSASGAQPPTGPHYGERNTDADSNIISLADRDPSRSVRLNSRPLQSAAPFIRDEDRDFGALCFALFGLTCPFALVGGAITIWMLFFE